MVNYETMTIEIGHQTQNILKFDVWFHTPFGFCPTINDAKAKVESAGLPVTLIRAFPVVIGEGGLYEVLI